MSEARLIQRNDGQGEVEAARVVTVEAIQVCRDADAAGSFEDQRVRGVFDPTWKAMQASVIAYTRVLRGQGLGAEAAQSAVRLALGDAASDFSPPNEINSAALRWCRRAYFAPGGSSSVIPL